MSDANASLISTMPDFLTWQAGNELTRSACKIHVQYVYHQVKQWSSHGDTDLFPLITSLPATSQQRLLLAPRLYTLLRSKSEPGAGEISSLKQLLKVEKYLCNQDGDPPLGSWTALYDFYFAPDQETFKAPRLGSIVLDGYRPFTNLDYPPPMGDDVTNHTAQELEFITRRIEQSLEQISRVS